MSLSLLVATLVIGNLPVGLPVPLVVPETTFQKVALPSLEEDEIIVIERLIQVSQEQLKQQLHLKGLMVEFQKKKEVFSQGNQTKPHVSAMVRTAREILEIITQQHWQTHFSQDYLDELTFFASIAGKNGIKRP